MSLGMVIWDSPHRAPKPEVLPKSNLPDCHLFASLQDVTCTGWVRSISRLTRTSLGFQICGKPDTQALLFSPPPALGSAAVGLTGETPQALATLWSPQAWTAQVCARLWKAPLETQLTKLLKESG